MGLLIPTTPPLPGSTLVTDINATFANLSGFGVSNAALNAQVASNNLTITLTTLLGVNPTVADAVAALFRSTNIAAGQPVQRQATSVKQFTINNGNTMGGRNNMPFRLWIVLFDNGVDVTLGAINALSQSGGIPTAIAALDESVLQTTTGANGGSSGGTFYAAAALTNKPFRIIGYMEWSAGLPTTGVWSAGPTKIQMFGPGIKKPGDTVQAKYATTSGVLSTTSATPGPSFNDTITPTSECNVIQVDVEDEIACPNANVYLDVQIRRGSATGIGARLLLEVNASNLAFCLHLQAWDAPGSIAVQTYGLYFATGTPGSIVYCPISTAAPPYGTQITKEIMA